MVAPEPLGPLAVWRLRALDFIGEHRPGVPLLRRICSRFQFTCPGSSCFIEQRVVHDLLMTHSAAVAPLVTVFVSALRHIADPLLPAVRPHSFHPSFHLYVRPPPVL